MLVYYKHSLLSAVNVSVGQPRARKLSHEAKKLLSDSGCVTRHTKVGTSGKAKTGFVSRVLSPTKNRYVIVTKGTLRSPIAHEWFGAKPKHASKSA